MNNLTNKKIVLIGGAGFIGHNLALALKHHGAKVSIIDSLQVNNLLSFANSKIKNQQLYWNMLNQRINLLRKAKIKINVVDARDYDILSRALNTIAPDVIIHLAAISHANKSNKTPHSTFDHSLRTLENALDWARPRVKHFIYLSSSMVYGHFKSGIVTEETTCRPIGIYGALKLAGEGIVKAYNQTFNLPYTIIRPSALYGERCVSRRVGQIFIESALKGEEININGNGADKLDFTYINDLISGIIKVIKNKNSINQTFNLTYGKSRSINDLVNILSGQFPKLKINYLPKNNLEPNRGTLCVDKAKKLIGHNPQYPIEIGYPKYIEWYKSNWGKIK
jgi:nucleoside-diphosphate-sugar epimerase